MRNQELEPLKMNLQLFARGSGDEPAGDEPGNEPGNESGNEPDDAGGDEPGGETPSEDDASLAKQVAQLRVENAKIKKAMDKAASEAAGYKKKLREKQSAEEIALQEKAEREAEREEAFQKLLKENTVAKYEKNFLALGYSEDLAAKAANAQYDGDTEELFKIQQNFQNALLKQKETEWAKSRPDPPAGNGEDEP